MRLLIAEDDKALGLFLSRGLESEGHRVRLAQDGSAAVEAFRQELPDLTILDLSLPIKDGEQVLAEIRALDGDLPVLVLTARQEVDTRVRCLDLGADDLMVKPFSLHELNHAYWGEVNDTDLAVGTPEHGVPDWRTAPPIRQREVASP